MAWRVTSLKSRLRTKPPALKRQRGFINLALLDGASLRPSFDLPLVDMSSGVFTIAPRFAKGSSTPTYTGATAKTTIDFEGLLKTCLSGEVRCLGGRRVRNMLNTTSEDFAAAAWNSNGLKTLQVADGGIAPPSVASSVDKLYEAAAGAGSIAHRMTNSVTTVLGNTYVAQVRAKKGERKRIFLYHFQRGAWFDLDLGTTGADSWYPTSVESAIGLGSDGYYLCTMKFTANFTGTDDFFVHVGSDAQTTITATRVGDGASGLYASAVQLENVTGQSSQNPSEYVSVGVLSAPVYHGVGVDGVKVFTTLNGNTVASKVVTEATGASITSAQGACAGGVTAGVVDAVGPVGYLPEGARTNLCLQSQALGTTWTNVRATESLSATAAPDGTLTAWGLIADTNNNTHAITQAITFTAAAHTFSVFLHAANKTWAYLEVFDGTTSDTAFFNLSGAGSVGTVSGATATISALPNGWYRATVTSTTLAAAGGLYIYPADGDNDITFVGDATTADLIVWGAQLEAAAFAGTYIPTTTVAVARNADVLTYPAAGNLNEASGAVYCEVKSIVEGAFGAYAHYLGTSGTSSNFQLGATTSTNIRANDAANEPDKSSLASTYTAVRKRASSWSAAANNISVTGDGATPATSAYDGSFGAGATLGVGNNTAGNASGLSTMRGLRIYPRAMDTQVLTA